MDQVTKALEQRKNPEGQTDRSKNKADNNRNLAETLVVFYLLILIPTHTFVSLF